MKPARTLTVLLFLLPGCSYSMMPSAEWFPANLTSPVVEPEPLQTPADLGDVVNWCAEVAGALRQCVDKHGALGQAVKHDPR